MRTPWRALADFAAGTPDADSEVPKAPRFPHCDARVLHAPGECQTCDGHPDWQELRKAWGVAFTGYAAGPGSLNGALVPCPADVARPPGSASDHRRWGGNLASAAAFGGNVALAEAFEHGVISVEEARRQLGIEPESDLPNEPLLTEEQVIAEARRLERELRADQ